MPLDRGSNTIMPDMFDTLKACRKISEFDGYISGCRWRCSLILSNTGSMYHDLGNKDMRHFRSYSHIPYERQEGNGGGSGRPLQAPARTRSPRSSPSSPAVRRRGPAEILRKNEENGFCSHNFGRNSSTKPRSTVTRSRPIPNPSTSTEHFLRSIAPAIRTQRKSNFKLVSKHQR